MRFSVVIPTLGRDAPMLADALASAAACEPPPDEVLVVDGSDDAAARPVVERFAASPEALEPTPSADATAVDATDREPARSAGAEPAAHGAGAPVFVHRSSPRGASVQRNVGLDAASGDVVVFTDDDAVLDPGLIGVLRDVYSEPTVVGATGRVVQDAYRSFGNQRSGVRRLLTGGGRDGSMTSYGYPRHVQDEDHYHDVEFMQGCLMSVRRDVARDVGFDCSLGGPRGVALLEDEDFSYRLSRRGRVGYFPEAVVHHRAAGFRARDPRFYSRLIVLDRAYLLAKNFAPTPLTLVKFVLLVAVFFAHRIVNREWRGVVGLAEGLLEARRRGYLRAAPRALPESA